jgi:hypothetical protein
MHPLNEAIRLVRVGARWSSTAHPSANNDRLPQVQIVDDSSGTSTLAITPSFLQSPTLFQFALRQQCQADGDRDHCHQAATDMNQLKCSVP